MVLNQENEELFYNLAFLRIEDLIVRVIVSCRSVKFATDNNILKISFGGVMGTLTTNRNVFRLIDLVGNFLFENFPYIILSFFR
jgi:hypothetical protein